MSDIDEMIVTGTFGGGPLPGDPFGQFGWPVPGQQWSGFTGGAFTPNQPVGGITVVATPLPTEPLPPPTAPRPPESIPGPVSAPSYTPPPGVEQFEQELDEAELDPIEEVTVTAPRDRAEVTPIEAAIAAGYGWGGLSAAPRPRPAPRRRPPRRRPAPKKKPPSRRPGRRALPRIPIPKPLARVAAAIARVGRLLNPVGLFLYSPELGGGERQFLEDYYHVGNFDDDEPDTGIPGAGRLPDIGDGIGSVTVRAPRFVESSPSPTAPFGLAPFHSPGLSFYPTPGLPVAAPGINPSPSPRVEPQPRGEPVNAPRTLPDPFLNPLPLPNIGPAPRPNPRPVPTPRVGSPIPLPFAAPLTPSQPGRLTLPGPIPTPKQETQCKCPTKPKKKKKSSERTECRTGTYTQLRKGIVYHPKRIVSCQ